MNDEQRITIAANLERGAFAFLADASLYRGRRREWRLNRYRAMRDRAYSLIEEGSP